MDIEALSACIRSSALLIAERKYGSGTFRSSLFSLLGAKDPIENFRSQERKFSVGTFAPGNESSRKFSGTFNPGNETRELSFLSK